MIDKRIGSNYYMMPSQNLLIFKIHLDNVFLQSFQGAEGPLIARRVRRCRAASRRILLVYDINVSAYMHEYIIIH